MPSSTFFNLPETKRRKLLQAAEAEFRRVPLANASINRIIKDAGISRGSFYMYFEDKTELFQYLCQQQCQQVNDETIRLFTACGGDLFDGFLRLFDLLGPAPDDMSRPEWLSDIYTYFKNNGSISSLSAFGLKRSEHLQQMYALLPCLDRTQLCVTDEETVAIIELLFSKKDIRKPECRQVFNRICRSETAIRNLGRTLLQVALKTEPEIVNAWYEEGVGKFLPDMDNRIINNLACCYAGLKLAEALCAEYHFAWDDVFPYSFDACVRYMEMAAKDYMLDGGTHNQSIIEQTFEIMARMQLDPRTDYTLSEDGNTLYIRLTQVYDKYTKYRKDYAILGEVLPYQQFKKQLLHSDLLIQSNAQKRIGPNSVKCWIIDFVALSARCDVSGFITTEIEPLK